MLYVATEGEDSGLTVVDAVADKAVKRFRVFGERPNEIDVTSDGRYLYLPARGDCCYEVFDTVNEEIVAKIPVTGLPHKVVVSPDDRFMYLREAYEVVRFCWTPCCSERNIDQATGERQSRKSKGIVGWAVPCYSSGTTETGTAG